MYLLSRIICLSTIITGLHADAYSHLNVWREKKTQPVIMPLSANPKCTVASCGEKNSIHAASYLSVLFTLHRKENKVAHGAARSDGFGSLQIWHLPLSSKTSFAFVTGRLTWCNPTLVIHSARMDSGA